MSKARSTTRGYRLGFLFSGILFILFILLLISSTDFFAAALIFVFYIILALSVVIFWQYYLFPVMNKKERIMAGLWSLLLFPNLSKHILQVMNGQIKSDYFLLRNKPQIFIIKVDEYSVAISQLGNGERRIYFEGIHLLKFKEKIIHIYRVDAIHFQFGQKYNRLSILKNEDGLIFRHIDKDQLNFPKFFSRTGDGVLLSTTFSVFYKIDTQKINDLINLSIQFELNRIMGETTEFIQELISQWLLSLWSSMVSKIDYSEVNERIPVEFSKIISDQLSSFQSHQISKDQNHIENPLISDIGRVLLVCKPFLNNIMISEYEY